MILRCIDTRCGTCRHLQDGAETVKLSWANVHFLIKEKMTCEVRNVIYLPAIDVENYILTKQRTFEIE